MKKILVDASPFNEGYHGTTIYLRNLYREYKEDYEVIFLVAINSNQEEFLQQIIPGARRVFYFSNGTLIDMLTLGKLINSIAPDFVHFQYKMPLFVKAHSILTIHDVLYMDFPQLFPRNYRLIRRIASILMIRIADSVVTVSEYSADRIKRRCYFSGKIHIIPNAVQSPIELSTNINLGIDFDTYNTTVLSINRIEMRKGQIELLNAMKTRCDITAKNRILFVFVGNDTWGLMEDLGYNSGRLYKMSENLDWIWFSSISDDIKNYLLQKVDLYLNTSAYEGFGIGVIEAAAFQKYIVSPLNTALKELEDLIDAEYDEQNPVGLLERLLYTEYYSNNKPKAKDVSKYGVFEVRDMFFQNLIY